MNNPDKLEVTPNIDELASLLRSESKWSDHSLSWDDLSDNRKRNWRLFAIDVKDKLRAYFKKESQ